MLEDGKTRAIHWIDDNQQHLIDISDTIWRYAELGFQEFKSSQLLAQELEKHGFNVDMGIAGIPTAFVASYGTGNPVIGILGEYDALYGLSQRVTTHKEPLEEGAPGHGCGHNIHGVSAIAGAIATRRAMESEGIPGTVKLFGCPAEEVIHGKVWMVREGVFKGIDVALSHHTGTINIAKLASNLANNTVKFHFYGKTAHAAGSPEHGRSALDAVELMNMGVNYLREHIIQEARIHYVIEEGGGQPNVVPGYARTWYYIRAPQRAQVDAIYQRILDIAEGATLMTGTTHEVEFIKGVHNLLPNRVIGDVVTKNMRAIGAPTYSDDDLQFAEEIAKTISKEAKQAVLLKTRRPDWQSAINTIMDQTIHDPWDEGMVRPGSTDVSDVSWQVPTMEFSTATWVLGTPGHSWQAVAQSGMGLGHRSLIFASKVIATTALDFLLSPELVKKAWGVWRKTMEGRIFRSHASPTPPLDIWSK